MKDLIDRQVAIEAVCRGCSGNFYQECQAYHGKKTFCDQIKRLRAVPPAQGYADTAYIERLSDLAFDSGFALGKASAQRWIPVSERLPEIDMSYPHHEDYLVQYDSGDMDVASWSNANRFWIDHVTEPYWNCVQFAKVIAWMPLPEPYREEDKDERSN